MLKYIEEYNIHNNENDGFIWEIYFIQLDNKTIGIIELYAPFEDKPNELWLGWFGIYDEYRNQGIGRIVIEKIIDIVKEKGEKKLKLYSSPKSKVNNFYKKNGFEPQGEVGEMLSKSKYFFHLKTDIIFEKVI